MIGVCLAAGFGTRLRPLTDQIPKAALPVMGVSSLYYSLDLFEKSGLFDVFINTHFLPKIIRPLIQSPVWSRLNLKESFEPKILGTAGVYRPIMAQTPAEKEGVIALNADILSDFDLSELREHVLTHRPYVAMVTVDSNPNGNIHSHNGRITGFAPGGNSYGAGMFFFSSEFLRNLPVNCFDLLPEIQAAIHQGHLVTKIQHRGFWLDFGGSLPQYFSSHQSIAQNKSFFNDRVRPLYNRLTARNLTLQSDGSVCDDDLGDSRHFIQNSFVFSSQLQAPVTGSLVVGSVIDQPIQNCIALNGLEFVKIPCQS